MIAVQEIPIPSGRPRLQAATMRLDAVTARLYACDVARGIAHHFTARYRNHTGVTVAWGAARRLARGNLSEWERAGAERSARDLAQLTGRLAGPFNRPFHCAVMAAVWCLSRDARKGLYWAVIWAVACEKQTDQAVALDRYCDELEALSAPR